MLFCEKCIYAAQKTGLLLRNSFRNAKFETGFVPQRPIFSTNKPKESSSINKENKNNKLKRLKGIDDENFSHNLKLAIRSPKLLAKGLVNFLGEFKKFYNEESEKFAKTWNPRVDDRQGRVDMLYTFETQDDINKFSVHTDSSYNKGYSSASLKLTNEGTAVFSGNICNETPKDGNVRIAGYASILSHKKWKSFYRPKLNDWSEYTDLVLKIRGDGRTYMIVLNVDTPYLETKYFQYGQYLFTRGGPYWQIAKIHLSHFFSMRKGSLFTHQFDPDLLHKITRIGITAAAYEGPFKLEIDYIGLEHDIRFKRISPFEEYR